MGDKGDKTSGRRAYHPTKGNKKEDKLVHKLGDKLNKDSGRRTHHPAKGNKKGDNGRQAGRRTHHPTKGNKKGDKLGDKGTTPREGRHTIQERETGMETSWETSW